MGVFFTSPRPVAPAIKTAIENALLVNPSTLTNFSGEAANRAVDLTAMVAPTFNTWRFVGAVAISLALLLAAIWTEKEGLHDISKALMNSFAGFSGIVLGLLGGEAQKPASS